jgi:galactonate dehydratase
VELVIERLEALIVNATPRTNWTFIQVETEDGLRGYGEATLVSFEDVVLASLELLKPRFLGQSAHEIERLCRLQPGVPGGLAYAAALSGIEQALWDIKGQALHAPAYQFLGGACQSSIRLYANINRSLREDRSPAAFARQAQAAVAAGFGAVKCAPFDGLVREPLEHAESRQLYRDGLARIEAVRQAVGDEIDLMVDCHWRFDLRTALRVLPDLEAFDLFWLEAPVTEKEPEAWATVRRRTPMRLAGAEHLVGLRAFDAFMRASGADVVMPDVKYTGGLSGVKKIGALAEAAEVAVAPHNPSGPVACLASAQVAAAMPNTLILEYAWGEADWRADLVGGRERIENGRLLLPDAPGLGVDFNHELAQAHPRQPIRPMLDPRLW